MLTPLATPLVKVMGVAVPKATPATVGLVAFGDALEPVNVNDFEPV